MISFICQRPFMLTSGLSFHIMNHQWDQRYIIICDIRWQLTRCVCLWKWGGGWVYVRKMCCRTDQLNVYLMGARVHSGKLSEAFRGRYRKALSVCHLLSLNELDLMEGLLDLTTLYCKHLLIGCLCFVIVAMRSCKTKNERFHYIVLYPVY